MMREYEIQHPIDNSAHPWSRWWWWCRSLEVWGGGEAMRGMDGAQIGPPQCGVHTSDHPMQYYTILSYTFSHHYNGKCWFWQSIFIALYVGMYFLVFLGNRDDIIQYTPFSAGSLLGNIDLRTVSPGKRNSRGPCVAKSPPMGNLLVLSAVYGYNNV